MSFRICFIFLLDYYFSYHHKTKWGFGVLGTKLVQACPVKEFMNQPEPSWWNKLLTGELVQACLVKHVFEPLVSQPIR